MSEKNKIEKCCDCSIKIFMECLFHGRRELLNGGNFEEIFTEYVDLSGIGETQEYNLMNGIHNIQTRMVFIESMIEFHKRFLKEFNMPYVDGFKDLRKYGHRLTWDPEHPQIFVQQLQMMEIKEKKNQAELDKMIKELNALKKDGVKPDKNGRVNFVRQLNNLGKAGYDINRETTDMEALALMIKDHGEEVMAEALKKR